MFRQVFIGTALAVVLGASYGISTATPTPSGKVDIYDRYCSPCHGENGDGRGPGAPWLWPRPRDFTTGDFKWRTTASGLPPTDDDLRLVIRKGVTGTSMHSFAASLSDAQIDRTIAIIKTFAPRKFRRTATPADIGDAPAITPELIALGRSEWTTLGCQNCHGTTGRGDGPSAAGLKDPQGFPAAPYDLTRERARRPVKDAASLVQTIYSSLLTGLSGTAMPSYEGAVSPDRLWAVAAYAASLQPDKPPTRTWKQRVEVHANAALADRKNPAGVGLWPGTGKGSEVWGKPVPVQGTPPKNLAPAQASLSAAQCARCHDSQYQEWRTSLHSKASSPGTLAQLVPMEQHSQFTSLESCQRCHAPLAEQMPMIRASQRGGSGTKFEKNPYYSEQLRDEGISCAGCHLREWTRHGPPTAQAKRLSIPGYPFKQATLYERSDFCIGCHQLEPRNLVDGRPLLNTYREWLEGPYMRRGVQCQHCHMPDRNHKWKGVHDPDTFRQGIRVDAIASRSTDGTVSVRARMWNAGAGHFLPTTPTPAAWLTVELVDESGDKLKSKTRIEGATANKRIGRLIEFKSGKFREVEDTRIPPGEFAEVSGAWRNGDTTRATGVRVTVRVHPDDYYEGFYRRRLNGKLSAFERKLFKQALAHAERNRFVAYQRTFAIK